MVYRKISQDMKVRAMELIQRGWDIEEVVDALGVSEKSVGRWSENLRTHGCVNRPSVRRGRPRLLTTAMTDGLRALIQETPSLFLDEIGEWLAIYHDQPISTTALHDNLRELGLTHKVMRRVAAERDDEERSNWMYQFLATYTADQMVVLDESSKDGRTLLRKYGRALVGEDPVIQESLDRGVRYSILPALTLDGYMAVRVIEGSINGMEFLDFVVNDVLPYMTPYPGPRSVMVVDNCGTHKSEAVRRVVESAGCRYIFLPPYSPDFSPIEESFSCLKAYIRRNYRYFQNSFFPEWDLAEACFTAITPTKARGWFHDCGYL